MKKLLIIVLVLILGIAVYFYTSTNHQVATQDTTPASNSSFKPDPSNALFVFDDAKVTLSSGKANIPASEENFFPEDVTLLEERAYGDLNGDGKNDTAVLLARSGGGSGTFIYVGAYFSGPVNYRGSNLIFIGDRISPQSVSINASVITVNYLDRGPDEPFSAEPTIKTAKEFVLRNGSLEER